MRHHNLRAPLVAPEMSLPPRTTRVCVACGPLREHAEGGRALELTLRPVSAPGRSTELVLRDVRALAPREPPQHVVVQVRDKSQPGAFFRVRVRHDVAAGVRLSVAVPAHAGYDLYSARAVVVEAMDVAFARTLSVLVPAGA